MDCTSFYKTGTYAMGNITVSKLFAGAPIRLINNVNDRQGVCIAPSFIRLLSMLSSHQSNK